MQQDEEIIERLRQVFAQIVPLIDAKRASMQQFMDIVIGNERIAGFTADEIIRRQTLRKWINYFRNDSLHPAGRHVAVHLPFITNACKSIVDIHLADSNDHAEEALYLIREEPFSRFVKIGKIACGNIKIRMRAIQYGNPRTLELIKYVKLDSPTKMTMANQLIDNTLAARRVSTEWYLCEDNTDLNLLVASFDMIANEMHFDDTFASDHDDD